MVVNLEFINVIVRSQEVLLFDPLRQEVLPLVDQLSQQLPPKSSFSKPGARAIDMQDNELQVSTHEK